MNVKKGREREIGGDTIRGIKFSLLDIILDAIHSCLPASVSTVVSVWLCLMN